MQIHKNSSLYATAASVFVLFIALYPQIALIVTRGSSWNGTSYITNYDETAYAAYVKALIDGKPRKADPFTGDDQASYESLYSIQSFPAFSIAVPARLFGISTSTAFILLNVFIAIASALALFWLIRNISGDDLLAVTGTIFVLALGTAVAFEGELRQLTQGSVVVDYFPFLRRYEPGVPFPLFLIYLGTLWKMYAARTLQRSIVLGAGAGVLISILIFSYFFLWTAALAFFGVFATAMFVFTKEKRRIAVPTAVALVIAVAALIPYFVLLRGRSPEIDSVQLLFETRKPDITSLPVLIGLVAVIAVFFLIRRNYFSLSEPCVLFALACGITPFVLLNQQVITGRSLQPIHFEIFVANYLALLAVVSVIGCVVRSEMSFASQITIKKGLLYLVVLSVGWGIVETVTATNRSIFAATVRDRSMSAIKIAEANSTNADHPTVLTPDMVTGDFVLSVSKMRPLWSPHTSSGGGISLSENKRLFYLYLYLNGITGRELAAALRGGVFEVTSAIFGSEKALPELGGAGQKINEAYITTEAVKYDEFVSTVDNDIAYQPQLDYVIVPSEAEPDYSRLDRWYDRQPLAENDGFKVYRLSKRF